MERISASDKALAALMYYFSFVGVLGGFVLFSFLLLDRDSFIQKHAQRAFYIMFSVALWVVVITPLVIYLSGDSFRFDLFFKEIGRFIRENKLEMFSDFVKKSYSQLKIPGKIFLISDLVVIVGAIVYSFICTIKAFLGKL